MALAWKGMNGENIESCDQNTEKQTHSEEWHCLIYFSPAEMDHLCLWKERKVPGHGHLREHYLDLYREGQVVEHARGEHSAHAAGIRRYVGYQPPY